MNKSKNIIVRLDEKLYTRLDNLARITNRTKSFYVRDAINDYLDLMDSISEYTDIQIAEKRLKNNNTRGIEGKGVIE